MSNGHQDPYNFSELTSTTSPDPPTNLKKSAVAKESTKAKANLQSWLSPHRSKGNDGNRSSSSTSTTAANSSGQLQLPGYDMTKLYPELSAKLGLIKSPGDASSVKSSNSSSSIKNGLTVRDNNVGGVVKKLENVSSDAKIRILTSGQSSNLSKMSMNRGTSSNVSNLLNQKSVSSKPNRNRSRPSDRNGKKPSVSVPSISKSNNQHDWRKLHDVSATSIDSIKSENKGGKSNSEDNLINFNRSMACSTTASTSTPGRNLSSAASTYPPAVGWQQQSRVVTIPPRKSLPPFVHGNNSKLPHKIVRVHSLYQQYYAYNTDLFSLGEFFFVFHVLI